MLIGLITCGEHSALFKIGENISYFNSYKRSILPEVLKLTVACQQMTNNNNGDFYFKIEVLKSKPQGNKVIEIICLQYAIQD